jgi:uncharacterized protein with HEPN domain
VTDRDLPHLQHVHEAITDVLDWDRERGREAFFEDRHHQAAMLRRSQTLTESASLLSEDLKDRHPEIDWRGFAGFRNIVVHDYLATLRPDRIYTYIEADLKPLVAAVEQDHDVPWRPAPDPPEPAEDPGCLRPTQR